MQDCQTSNGAFNVIVIGIEFQINQAHTLYCTEIGPPAHSKEFGIQLQMLFHYSSLLQGSNSCDALAADIRGIFS